MHSKIFQLSDKPISNDNFLCSEYFYEDTQYFADYIGDEVTDEKERNECICDVAEEFSEMLEYIGDGQLRYKGMANFLQDWVDAIKTAANALTADNILKEMNLYRLERLTQTTHKDSDRRFYVEDWNCFAGDAADFVSWLSHLKEGTIIYVGSIIDFHY